jgi:glycerol-3-phosphate acyltransferase PlsX
MGGDHGLSVAIPAAIEALTQSSSLSLILVGNEQLIRANLPATGVAAERVRVVHASEQVEMHEAPSKALRGKKDSSMRVAINLVRDGVADACVSAGNTGALMAIAKFVLKTIPGIDRPAIMATVPALKGHTHVLDLGANVDCTAEHLRQFAVMGYELVKAIEDNPNPSVGLLNIGSEDIKGNEQVKQAAKLIADSHINFIGYVEGNDMYTGDVDIVVTDGFVGNVALKSSEGLAKMISLSIRDAFSRNLLTKLSGLIALPALKYLRLRIDPRQYNGASLVGLRGIVVKSHGNADKIALARAIAVAEKEVHHGVTHRIGQRISEVVAAEVGA